MSSVIDSLVALRDAYNEAKRTHGQTLIKEALGPVFEAFPQVAGVSWTQYTPHFNDGDPCEFYANEIYQVLFTGTAEEAAALGVTQTMDSTGIDFLRLEYDDFADPRAIEYTADMDYENLEYYRRELPLPSAISDANGILQQFEDVLQETLGEGRVFVLRNGTTLVTEYDHD